MRLVLLTSVTMIAFASNSLLTRMAVESGAADPYSFAVLRVLAGASVLAVIMILSGRDIVFSPAKRFVGALSLASYMIGFSLAYLTLDAGLGALILFGVVQISMFSHGVIKGQGPTARQFTGAGVAFCGLLVVLWPGAESQTDLTGALLMIVAGVGWAVYTITGRSAVDPLSVTGANFMLCLPLIIILLAVPDRQVTLNGYLLALVCGGLTSGLGYALWYLVLPQLRQSIAAVVQLSVPVIAIVGGALFLGEAIAFSTLAASAMVLGGIALAITSQSFPARRK
ncbi:DMT family transporter [uncultured Roseobacter sp.]|uniref:DMT family transporter n=1 Tax=uncultured Roseobacter sp. TaxID=114847 RepID=UPI00261E5F4E|nr:DMT family transporter [uncultured Roseobacter sp.]